MDRILLINVLTTLAILLEIFWVTTDPRSKDERVKSLLSPRVILYGLYALIFFILNYLSGLYFPLPSSGLDSIFVPAGILIFISGFILSIWAKVTMGKIWGVPAHMRNDQNKLIKNGPFKYTRNPIYAGLIMVLIGYGLSLQSYFTPLVLIAVYYFWRASEKEEYLLEKHFGSEYLKYKKEVPRFF